MTPSPDLHSPTSPDSVWAELAALALSSGRAAAALAASHARGSLDVTTKTTSTDMVTAADRASETLIVERLRAARPDDLFLAEEGTGADGLVAGDPGPVAAAAGPVTWVIDPIDGTTNFVYGLPGGAVAIAARVRDRVVAGVVGDITHGDEFVATLGGGATRNGERLRLADPPPLSRALLATGFGYDPERRASQAAALATILPRVRDIRRMGAAAVDLCSVACGRVDAYYEWGLAAWDYSAGALVATEAGARVARPDGGPLQPDGRVVAAHPDLWGPLVELLGEAGA